MSEKNRVHHVYDGIEEEDNRLPNWWVAILLGTIVFSFGYWFVYETTKTLPSPLEAYKQEREVAEADRIKREATAPLGDESLWAMSKNPEAVEAGRKVFASVCASCHSSKGEGSIGPNLTDKYWIHGAAPMDLVNAVNNGFPDKGMESWGARLGDKRVKEVVAFVLSIRHTNVPGKAPEGDILSE